MMAPCTIIITKSVLHHGRRFTGDPDRLSLIICTTAMSAGGLFRREAISNLQRAIATAQQP